MYRFLVTPRWLGFAAATIVLATVMVGLGNWQLDRYRQRTAINDRIDAAATAAPVPVGDVLHTDRAPPATARYTRVTATGRYDPAHEILVRGRTVEGRVGFEVLTPLVLPGGTAVLVDRGWVAPGRTPAGAAAGPDVPTSPAGEVTVTGVVRLPEHTTSPVTRRGGHLEVRGINPARLRPALPYPVLGGYLTTAQDGLTPVPIRPEGTLQNGGYAIQWWAFAVLALVGFGYLARREAHGHAGPRTSSARTESMVSASAADLSSR